MVTIEIQSRRAVRDDLRTLDFTHQKERIRVAIALRGYPRQFFQAGKIRCRNGDVWKKNVGAQGTPPRSGSTSGSHTSKLFDEGK